MAGLEIDPVDGHVLPSGQITVGDIRRATRALEGKA